MYGVNKLSSYWYSIEILWKCMCLINKIIKLYQQCLHYLNNKQWINSLNICEINLGITVSAGGRLNKKDGLTRYGDSHVKDNTS